MYIYLFCKHCFQKAWSGPLTAAIRKVWRKQLTAKMQTLSTMVNWIKEWHCVLNLSMKLGITSLFLTDLFDNFKTLIFPTIFGKMFNWMTRYHRAKTLLFTDCQKITGCKEAGKTAKLDKMWVHTISSYKVYDVPLWHTAYLL